MEILRIKRAMLWITPVCGVLVSMTGPSRMGWRGRRRVGVLDGGAEVEDDDFVGA